MLHTLIVLIGVLASFCRVGQPADSRSTPEPVPRPPRLVMAFYYPWYGTPEGAGGKARGGVFVHWEGVDPAARSIASSTNYPVSGAYDSHDPKVIERHCREAKFAGIDVFIISWWGKGSFEDEAVAPILDACAEQGLKAAIYYEQVAKPGTPASVAAEIAELVKRYSVHPAYLKVKKGDAERAVFFVYSRALHQLGNREWKEAVGKLGEAAARPILIADDFGSESLATFDGSHSYAPMGDLDAAIRKGETAAEWARRAMPWWSTHPRTLGKISCVTVFPGYDDTKIRKPGLKIEREGGKLYEMLWREAVSADPDWILITSFNEWHEGSEIEPSVEHGDAYLKLTATWASTFKSPDEREKRSNPPQLPTPLSPSPK